MTQLQTDSNVHNEDNQANDAKNEELNKLILDLENLIKDVETLKTNKEENKKFCEYRRCIEAISDKKRLEVDDWERKEIESAKKVKFGNEFAANCDLERRKGEIEIKIRQKNALKVKILKNQFPEIYKYFESKGYNFGRFSAEKPNIRDFGFVETKIVNERVLSNEEVQYDSGMLLKGASAKPDGVEIGKNVRIKSSKVSLPDFGGEVVSIENSSFTIKMNNGKTIPIMFCAISMGDFDVTVS